MTKHFKNRIAAGLGILLGCVVIPCGCEPGQKSVREMWIDFAGDMMAAARDNDVTRLVEHLTLYKDDDLKRLKATLSEAGEDLHLEDEGTEPERRSRATWYARLFLNSYRDVFDGEVRKFSTAELRSIPGLEAYSLVIWVEKDGKFRGIMIDHVCRIGNRMLVADWVVLSGYELDTAAHGTLVKMRAVLEADAASGCRYPHDPILYETEYIGGGIP
ncbi:MAG: hypothetical protein WBE26_19585 [Phycisphaerae bacterium]